MATERELNAARHAFYDKRLECHGIRTEEHFKEAMECALNAAAAEREKGRFIVYLRQMDADTDNACWVICAKNDPGAKIVAID